MKKTLNWGAFLAFLVATFVLAGPTILGGPATYVMVSGSSMEPTYSDGDLVVALEQDSYDRGDVVVYDAPVQGEFNIVHRVVETTPKGVITQGDNRADADSWVIPHERVYGSVSVHVPQGGRLVSFLRTPWVVFVLVLVLGGLTVHRRRPGRSEGDPDAEEHGARPGAADERAESEQ